MHLHALLDDVFTGTAVLHIRTEYNNRISSTAQIISVWAEPSKFVFSLKFPESSDACYAVETWIPGLAELQGVSGTSCHLQNLSLVHKSGARLSCSQRIEIEYSKFLSNDELTEAQHSPLYSWACKEGTANALLQVECRSNHLELQVDCLPESPRHPWIASYSGATNDFHHTSQARYGNAHVHLNALDNGILELRSESNLSHHEERLVLALAGC